MTAFEIVTKESSWDSNAEHLNPNGTTDYGLFQINEIHKNLVNGNVKKLLDPETNIKIAYNIFKEQGCKAWAVPVESCQYKPNGIVAGQK